MFIFVSGGVGLRYYYGGVYILTSKEKRVLIVVSLYCFGVFLHPQVEVLLGVVYNWE